MTCLRRPTNTQVPKFKINCLICLHILREIASSLQQARYFAIMVDEVTDSSNKEQVVEFAFVQ